MGKKNLANIIKIAAYNLKICFFLIGTNKTKFRKTTVFLILLI